MKKSNKRKKAKRKKRKRAVLRSVRKRVRKPRTKSQRKTVKKRRKKRKRKIKKRPQRRKLSKKRAQRARKKTEKKKEKEVVQKATKDQVASKKLKAQELAATSQRAQGLTPMRIYLNQIEHIPLLTASEELSLSRTIQLKKSRWKQARRKMIRSNLRLVINIGKRYMNLTLPFSDIVEEGNIGLMRAVDKFNYKRGYRFSTYASWWIKQSIMRALSNQGKLIRIPVHMFETMNRWRKAKKHLSQKLGRVPTQREIAKLLKLPPEKVKDIEDVATSCPSSLHASVSIEGDAQLMDLIEDESLSRPYEEAHQVSKSERIETLLNYVSEREKKILILRFGLHNHDAHTLEETAQQFGITRERVRQIEFAALKKIRDQLKEQDDKLEHYL
ncbi:MAG: sigma-70 family RNA polymerase sigma factor [Candidatus Omnitrophica bacterium]|nr:sigma-70 family RNA polymerase sigma factor [Candidatus Omnitrophota bacterium]